MHVFVDALSRAKTANETLYTLYTKTPEQTDDYDNADDTPGEYRKGFFPLPSERRKGSNPLPPFQMSSFSLTVFLLLQFRLLSLSFSFHAPLFLFSFPLSVPFSRGGDLARSARSRDPLKKEKGRNKKWRPSLRLVVTFLRKKLKKI